MTATPPRRSGLAVPALAMTVLAAWLTTTPSTAWWIAVGAGASACAVFVARSPLARRLGMFRVAVLGATAVGCALVAAAIVVDAPGRGAAGLPTGVVVAMDVRVDAVRTTASNDHAGNLSTRLIVDGTLLSAAGRPFRAPVLLFPYTLPSRMRAPGTVIELDGVATRQAPDDDVAATVSVHGTPRIRAPADPLQSGADRLRAGFSTAARIVPGDGGALLPGLAIGDTSAVDPSLDAAMKASSLSHLTAVSGANCAVITAVVFALAGLLRLPRSARIAAAVVALLGFVVLVTPQPSVLRAGVMALIALAGLATGRRTGGLGALSLAVVVLVLVDPWSARTAGFVLSAAATAGLLLFTRPLQHRLERRLPPRVALAVAVPVAAQLACQPLLVLLQPSIPLFGVLANVLAEPAAPVATILGLIGCLVLPLLPWLGRAMVVLGWLPAAWIAWVARWAAALPALPWLPGAVGAVAAFTLLIAVLVALSHGPRRARIAGAVVAAAAVLVIVGTLVGSGTGVVAARLANWEIAACDVGQGDGLVLNGGGGHFALVDTGRRPAPIAACLTALGVGRVDLAVLTHYDADHVGAVRSLASRIGTAFVGPSDGAAADGLRAALVAAGVAVEQVHRGESARVGRLRLDVVWPPSPLGVIQPGNPASVTVVVHGTLTSLFTGDLGEAAQDALLAAGPLPRVDVVKVAHHGSADQSPAFYARLGAAVGVISVGVDNDYGHPTARLLGILAQDGILPERTDQQGMILLGRSAGGGVAVWSERAGGAARWRPARR